ncbi:MAG: DUF3576 domain-containing protein [Alphaproteobacteria bacterium]
MVRTGIKLGVVATLAVAVAGCEANLGSRNESFPTGRDVRRGSQADTLPQGGVFDGGLSLFGGGRDRQQEGAGTGGGIGVNAFLWRASLDTVSFMPLSSADPFGGVIITDWYAPPEAPDERFKATVYILDRQLRADGVRVALFKQVRAGADWMNADVEAALATELENRILARARELRVAGRTG